MTSQLFTIMLAQQTVRELLAVMVKLIVMRVRQLEKELDQNKPFPLK